MLMGRIKAQNKNLTSIEIYNIYVEHILGEKLAQEFLCRER